jgi:diguanylate cyclase (GGDEF)-like protein
MKLSTQLSSSLLIFLLAVFVGSFLINVKMTKEYVSEQLATHAQDTATSLGLSISPYMGQDSGMFVAETMVNAIFDRGYYKEIVLKNSDGDTVLTKQNPNKIDTVPEWFTQLVKVTPPVEKTEINDGWVMAGELYVQSHPGLANEKLWETITQSAIMFFGAFIIAYIFLLFIIRTITKPLSIVVEKINDIQNQKFSQINYKPFTTELSFITNAVNRLSRSIEGMFAELTARAEEFKSIAFEDSLTKLLNRNAFIRHMSALLSESSSHDGGYLLLVRCSQLAEVNNKLGANDGDTYVSNIAEALKTCTSSQISKTAIFRISGADFAVVFEGINKEDCEIKLYEISTSLGSIDPLKTGNKAAWLGASIFSNNDSLSEIMERADSALLAASKTEQGWQFASELSFINSNTEWRERLNFILEEQRAELLLQPITNSSEVIVRYYEVLARFKGKGAEGYIPMSQLIPASERLNLVPEIDKLVCKLAVDKLGGDAKPIGINLSMASIASENFRKWIIALLQITPANAKQIVFEIEDMTIVQYKNETLAFCLAVRELGCKITIEHFGENLASLAGIRAIQPDFLKVSGKLTKGIEESRDNQLFVSSLVSIANGLNIQVIAELVETEQESTALAKVGVMFQQGYLFSKPAQW